MESPQQKSKSSTQLNNVEKIVGLSLISLFISSAIWFSYYYKPKSTSLSPTPAPRNNRLKLKFVDMPYTLVRNSQSTFQPSLWDLPQETLSYRIDEDDHTIMDRFYRSEVGKIYFSDNRFFILESGGYATVTNEAGDEGIGSVDSQLNFIRQAKEKQGTSPKYLKSTSCKITDRQIGNISAKSMICTTQQSNPDNSNQKEVSTTSDCYLPLDDSYFLAYEQKLKPMGDKDLCTELEQMGLQDILNE